MHFTSTSFCSSVSQQVKTQQFILPFWRCQSTDSKFWMYSAHECKVFRNTISFHLLFANRDWNGIDLIYSAYFVEACFVTQWRGEKNPFYHVFLVSLWTFYSSISVKSHHFHLRPLFLGAVAGVAWVQSRAQAYTSRVHSAEQHCAMQDKNTTHQVICFFNMSAHRLSCAWSGLISCFWHWCDTQPSGGIRLGKCLSVQGGLRMERGAGGTSGGTSKRVKGKHGKVSTDKIIVCYIWKPGW